MFQINHQETQFDLRFHVGSTPVRVSPWFWLTSALLRWDYFRVLGIGYLLLWIGCCFISVLLHELGHVWAGMYFGSRGHIILWSFGGVAVGSNNLGPRWQRVAVSFAGPGIQLAFYGVLWLLLPWVNEHTLTMQNGPIVKKTLEMLMYINLWWPVFNLLLIWPLDGGMISRELCEGASPRKGLETSLYISIGVSGILALHCLMSQSQGRGLIPFIPMFGGYFTAMFMAMFCIENVQELQARRNPWGDDGPPWER